MRRYLLRAFPWCCLCVVMLNLLSRWVYASDIVIGMSAAFRGPSRALGSELYRGSMAYIEHVNRTGGVDGNRIVIDAYNDSYDPILAVENTLTLIEKDNIFLLFDYVGTPTVTRVLPLLRRYSADHLYLFFPYTGAQPQREAPYNQFVFNLRASYRQETGGLVDNFVRIGRKRIAVFYQADAYGRSGWDGVRRTLEKHNLKLAGEATYRRGATYTQSFSEQVQILQKENPDAIISIGAYAACAGFIRDVRNADWNIPIANISFVGSTPMLNLLRESSQALERDYTKNLIISEVVPSYDDTSLPAVRQYRDLIDRYDPRLPREFRGEEDQFLSYSFIGFEGFLNAKLLVEVLKRLGNPPNRAHIKEATESIRDYDLGIGAPISFSPDRHQGLNVVYYVTVQEGLFIPITDWKRWEK